MNPTALPVVFLLARYSYVKPHDIDSFVPILKEMHFIQPVCVGHVDSFVIYEMGQIGRA